jgi:hypothetical protein
MALYFNATNGPLAFTLRDGSAGSVAPKKWLEIPAEKESSASVVKLLKQGFLVRREVSETVAVPLTSSKPLVAPPAPAAPVVVAPVAPVVPAVVPAPVKSVVSSKESSVSVKESKKEAPVESSKKEAPVESAPSPSTKDSK